MRLSTVKQIGERLHHSYLTKVAAVTTFIMLNPVASTFAKSVKEVVGHAAGGKAAAITSKTIEFDIPIVGFFLGIINFMTGPFALVVGGLFIGAAAFMMMKGNAGGSLEKILYGCFGLGIIMFLGPILNFLWTSGSGSGMMIGG